MWRRRRCVNEWKTIFLSGFSILLKSSFFLFLFCESRISALLAERMRWNGNKSQKRALNAHAGHRTWAWCFRGTRSQFSYIIYCVLDEEGIRMYERKEHDANLRRKKLLRMIKWTEERTQQAIRYVKCAYISIHIKLVAPMLCVLVLSSAALYNSLSAYSSLIATAATSAVSVYVQYKKRLSKHWGAQQKKVQRQQQKWTTKINSNFLFLWLDIFHSLSMKTLRKSTTFICLSFFFSLASIWGNSVSSRGQSVSLV